MKVSVACSRIQMAGELLECILLCCIYHNKRQRLIPVDYTLILLLKKGGGGKYFILDEVSDPNMCHEGEKKL